MLRLLTGPSRVLAYFADYPCATVAEAASATGLQGRTVSVILRSLVDAGLLGVYPSGRRATRVARLSVEEKEALDRLVAMERRNEPGR